MWKKYRFVISATLMFTVVLLSVSPAFAAAGTKPTADSSGRASTISADTSDTPIPTDAPTDQATPVPTQVPSDTPTDQPTAAPSDTATPTDPATPTPPPWIQSDQPDYYAGSTVILTSGNWLAGEPVHLFVNDEAGQTWSLSDNVQADSSGSFTYQFQLPNSFIATYSVTATGTSSGVATTTFTDSVASISPTTAAEGAASFTLTVNGAAFTSTSQVTWTPPGGTARTLTRLSQTSTRLTATVLSSDLSDEGNAQVRVTGGGAGGPLNFAITEGDSLALTAQSISATTNAAFSGTVATMTDTYDNAAIGTFTATINWNDGSAASTGTITKTGVGAYSIAGSHTWSATFLQTSVKTATAYPAATIPVASNGTTSFAPSGSVVVFTGSGYQTLTYTGKTGGTSASFTGVSGWTGSGSLAVGNPVTQPFSSVTVTVTEASPGTATASTSDPLTVQDGITYSPSAGNFSTTEGAVYTGSSPFFPGSIATSVFPSVGNYRLLISNGSSSAWYTLYTSGPNNYMYPNSTTGSILFQDEGSVPYTETLYRNDGTQVCQASGTVTVNDAQLSWSAALHNYNATVGVSTGDLVVGQFLDNNNPQSSINDFTTGGGSVTIHWGDGNDTPASLSASGTTYTVHGSHSYAAGGTYHVSYTAVDDGGATAPPSGLSYTTIVVNTPPSGGADAASVTVDEGATASNTGTYSDPDAGQSISISPSVGTVSKTGTNNGTWSWSFGTDDGPAQSQTVTITLNDGNGGVTQITFALTVNNVAPSATFSNSGPVDEGSAFSLSLTNPSDPSSADTTAGFKYAFDCGDGSGYGPFSVSDSASCTTTDSGLRHAKGQIKDKDGGVSEYTADVTVNNVAPTANFAASSPISEGSSSALSFTGASDPSSADTAAGFHYSFACDGLDSSLAATYAAAGTASTANCPFPDNGSFTVKGRIFDQDSGYSDYSAGVTVNNVAPVLSAPGNQTTNEGLATSFTLGSFSDAGLHDGPWSVDVGWGDGSAHSTFNMSAQGALTPQAHTYVDGPISYTVTVTVTDKDGGSDSKTFNVDIKNVAPTVSSLTLGGANTTACIAGNSVTLNFGFGDPGMNDGPWAVDINWGDGSAHTTYSAASQGAQAQQSHIYSAGAFTISVKVTDKDSGVGNSSGTNTVSHLFNMSGILDPFNPDGSSVWKYGSTLPVKVKITDCKGAPVSNLKPNVGTTLFSSNDPTVSIDETASTSAADTTGYMRYDPSAGQYIYNFGSKYLSDPSATYYMTVKGTDANGNIVTAPGIVQVKFGLKPK